MRRLIFQHASGLFRILGVVGEDAQPITLANFSAGDETIAFASLYKADGLALYYKEPMVPASYTFHQSQR